MVMDEAAIQHRAHSGLLGVASPVPAVGAVMCSAAESPDVGSTSADGRFGHFPAARIASAALAISAVRFSGSFLPSGRVTGKELDVTGK